MPVHPIIAAGIKFEDCNGLKPELKIPVSAKTRKIQANKMEIHAETNACDRDKMISVMSFLNCLEKISSSSKLR